jgi:hypothetical protein
MAATKPDGLLPRSTSQSVGEWARYGLTPTTPPTWSTSSTQNWLRDYANEPIRLSITARSKDRTLDFGVDSSCAGVRTN